MATESLPESTPAHPPRPELEARAGMKLGRYQLLVAIASGGMAQVWIAEQRGEHGFRRLVALKTIRPEHAESTSFRRMFLDEARLASRIRHANVVEVVDLGEEGPIVFSAMTLVEGDSLAGLLRRWGKKKDAGGLPPAVALRMLADACAGLHAAHELTDEDGRPLMLVHRDVSPHNILVGVDGVSKITDFGIAKARSRLADETEAGQLKGKFSYLAPEQVARQAPDRRSDVFAAGIVLWEALTGVRLFRGADVVDTLARVAQMRIPDPREIAPELPPHVAAVTMSALARDPAARFQTAAEMADAIDAAARATWGGLASARDVAALVNDLAGAHVEELRARVRAGRRGEDAGAPLAPATGTFAATSAPGDTIVEGRRVRAPWVLAAAAGAIAIGISAAFVVPRLVSRAPAAAPIETTTTTTTSTSTSTPTPTPTPTSTSTSTSTATASSTPNTTATASSIPSASASSTPPSSRPTPRPRTTTTATPAPQPKYGNPYGP